MTKWFSILAAGVAALVLVTAQPAVAQSDKPHKMVIQVSTADPDVHRIALNNAVNLQKALGPDEVEVEIVAYGPGLSIFTAKSPESARVPDLALQQVTFSACGNTMNKMAEKSGEEVQLVDGVQVVPAGVLRIMELQEQGYTYIRP